MIRENSGLREDPNVRQWLESALQHNQTLRTVYTFMQRLKALCAQTTGKTESDLEAACRSGVPKRRRAGFACSRDFARQLQAYTAQPA